MRMLQQRNQELYQGSVVNNRLSREITLLEETYLTFARRLEEARIASRTESDRLFQVSVLTQPQAGLEAVFPQKRRIIPLGLVVGFLLGCTVAFLMEFFDHTFKRPEDVETFASLPNLYSINKY